MKSKILTLVIGILIGAIITTIGFLIYNKTVAKNSNQPEMMQMDGNGQMGEKPDGDNGEAPEKPDGDNGEEPPTKPDESNTSTNS
jgi:cell division protein FtsN